MTRLSSGSCLRAYSQPADATLRLVCFPHAGGSATAYRDWTPLLPPSVQLTAIQYAGRQDRIDDPVPDSMHALADDIWIALSTSTTPMVLFGHSFGATVAFEVAQRIQRRGPGQVEHLVVSGRPGPAATVPTTKHLLGDDELWRDMLHLGGTDEELANVPALRELVLPGLRQDYTIIETYTTAPDATVSCPVTAFLGADDPEVDRGRAAAWEHSTTGAFRLRTFDGAHFYLNRQRTRVVSELLSLAPR